MTRRFRFRFKALDVYQAAVEHFAWTVEVAGRMPKGPFVVVDQAIRASLSVMGNVGEANGREKKWGEIEQHYRYSQGSAFESATHLDALAALGVITDEEYNAEEERLARISAMLTRLTQAQRRKRRRQAPKNRSQETEETTPPEAHRTRGPVSDRLEKRGPQAQSVEKPHSGVEKRGQRPSVERRPD